MVDEAQPLEKVISDDLETLVKTTVNDEGSQVYLSVDWIAWDSGFRDCGLAIGDRIIGWNAKTLVFPDEPRARRTERDRVVGGLGESAVLAELGLEDASPLTLIVLRREIPGRGYRKLEVVGKVRAERVYYDRDGKSAMAPGGPNKFARDQFAESWSSWYDRRLFDWERMAVRWQSSKLQSRQLMDDVAQWREQVDAAVQLYPGEWSKRLKEDFDALVTSMRGRAVQLPADALAFRDQSDAVEKEIAALGDRAWDAFLAANRVADTLAQIDLVRGDRNQVVGRLITLSEVSWQGAITEGDRAVMVSGHSGYACFISADQPAFQRFFAMQAQYQAKVEPQLRERYDLIGRVTGTRMVVIGSAVIGLDIEVSGVRVANQFFADVTGSAATFVGAELATARGATMPPDDASPSDVMRAYIAAVKAGDEKVFVGLYADWTAIGGDGLPLYRAYSPYERYLDDFTNARNLMLHKVSHVEPMWESDSRIIVQGDAFVGAPVIEEVSLMVDHIGHFDDGDFVFCTTGLNRLWELQRRDGGPWRLYSRNVL